MLSPHEPDMAIMVTLQFYEIKYLFIQIPIDNLKHLVIHKPYKHLFNTFCESGDVLNTLFPWILVT